MFKRLSAIATVLFLLTPSGAKSAEFNTAELLERAISLECINYCIIGICEFLDCGPTGCTIKTSPRIKHFLPDLIVSVYDSSEKHPWTEYGALMSGGEAAVSAGLIDSVTGVDLEGNSIVSDSKKDTDLRFKEASAVGHPFVAMAQESMPGTYMCPSDAVPYKPYFSSVIDYFAWRWGIPDSIKLDSIIPGRREVGSMTTSNLLGNTWGNVMPRTGFLVQQDDVKTSAVIAQRVADIVTNTGQPHIYIPLQEENYSMDLEPGERESQGGADEKSDKWQQVSPYVDSTCYTFGSNESDWSKDRDDGERRYGWAYWRKYECCLPQSGTYLGYIPTTPVCLN